MDDALARKLAANEAVFREVNERVEEVASAWTPPGEPMELICECSHEVCMERVHVTRDDYTRVRADDTRFLVVDSHVVEEIERRVATAGDATVVEKIGPGRAVVASAEA